MKNGIISEIMFQISLRTFYLILSSKPGKSFIEEKGFQLLEKMGLQKRITHKPGEMSGGEQQRVAVARAMIMEPEIVLADEPTGNLDTPTGREVFDLLLELNNELGTTLIIVTHNEEFALKMSRRIVIEDGKTEI